MIAVTGNRKIGYGITTTFEASGGIAPYTFSLVAGSQGSITSLGVYTAPETPGNYQKSTRARILVVDSTPVTPLELTFDVSVLNVLGLLGDSIAEFMGLNNGQIMIYNQKYNIPQDTKPYIALNFVSNKPYASVKKHETISGQFCSVQEISNSAVIDIDIMCRTIEALERKEEILMALKSDYSINQQAFNSFNLSTLPQSFINLTSEEGAAMLYRFKISIALQYTVRRVKQVDYYDQFNEPTILTNA
jgi:hypothetical protein